MEAEIVRIDLHITDIKGHTDLLHASVRRVEERIERIRVATDAHVKQIHAESDARIARFNMGSDHRIKRFNEDIDSRTGLLLDLMSTILIRKLKRHKLRIVVLCRQCLSNFLKQYFMLLLDVIFECFQNNLCIT